MRKLIYLFVFAVALVSCECPYCGGNTKHCDYCSGYKTTIQTYDGFCAETLLGTWQMDYNPNYLRGLGMEIKEIKFLDGHKCDITYSDGTYPTWYTDTYNYTYASGYIRFDRGRSSFTFKVKGFLFPELYLQDSFANYTWRKVRSYGC